MRNQLALLAALAGTTTAAPAVAAAAADCTRALLKTITDGYVAAQGAGSGFAPTSAFGMLAAAGLEYSENFKAKDVGEAILATPLKIDFSRSLLDTTQCATYTEVVVTDPAHPYVIGTQMHVDPAGGKVAKMETLVTDKGDWLFNATGTYYWASREEWTEIPEAERDSREAIQAAGDAYADIFDDKSVTVPWGTPCARLEGGAYTGRGSPTDSCNVGIPNGVKLTNRRYVIDEVLGAVDIFMTFGSLPDSHEFRLEKGKLRYVHTITVMGS